jgi:hypothetical protein
MGLNLNIVNAKVRSFSLDFYEVLWEIETTTLDPNDFQFYVLRSESPEGPWDIIAGPFEDHYRYIDNQVNPMHQQRQIFYRIRSVEKKDQENIVESESIIQYPDPDLIAQEIQRAERIVWNEFSGRACFLFPVRTFGKRCEFCYDGPEKGKGFTSSKRRSGCASCYDTSFVRGYFDPIQVYVQIDPYTESVQTQAYLQRLQADTRARLPNYPMLKPKDLLVESENRRWRVVTSTPTERLRSVVHQELTLHEIDRSEVEYQIPIRLGDLRDFEPSPIRNFANAQDIDSLTTQPIADIFAIYQRQR